MASSTGTSRLRSGRERKIQNPSIQSLKRRSEVSTKISRSRIPPRPSAPSRNARTHVLNVPPEIRDEIYKFLLVNPMLGQGSSVTTVANPVLSGTAWKKEVTAPKYDLHPVVLRVCKQMHQEGLRMLYERNVFYMDCTNWIYRDDSLQRAYGYNAEDETDKFPVTTALNVTPLTRYSEHLHVSPTSDDWTWQGNQLFYEQPPLSRLMGPQARYVRQWKVIVSGDAWVDKGRFAENALTQFCHVICQRPGLMLSFIVCTDQTSNNNENTTVAGLKKHSTFDEIFAPLKVLRNIARVEFREAHADFEKDVEEEEISEELPGYFDEHYRVVNDSTALTLSSGKVQEKYISLMKGSSQLMQPINLMCDVLVEYAQTFERVPELKQDMDVGTDNNEVLFKEDKVNKYKRPYHPIENLLRSLRGAAWLGDMNQFKLHRKELLQEIEKQNYQKIDKSSTNLHKFVKNNRIFRAFLTSGEFQNGIYTCEDHTLDLNKKAPVRTKIQMQITESLMFLEEYAASFAKDTTKLSRALRVEHRVHDPTHLYQALPREQLMRRIQEAYVAWDYSTFLQCFKDAVDDMDAQYIEIREAKKKVFQWDTGRPVRGLKVDVSDFEAIIWHELEPVKLNIFDLYDEFDRTLSRRR
ncbi:hypothetical protein NHQ30_005475 [Ciborinia camelliae]|nr:hypothetical protein NHQ30_005475 [Ciborinia camelliae]